MSLTVTVVDNETGDTDTAQVSDGDYLLICTDPVTTCVNHPDRPVAWVRSTGEQVCNECERPWIELKERHQAERAEMDRRHAAERSALRGGGDLGAVG